MSLLTTLSDLKHCVRAYIPLSIQDGLGGKRRLTGAGDAEPPVDSRWLSSFR